MDSFKILVEGYAKPGKDTTQFYASPTTTLIISKNKKVLVDPGANESALENGLKAAKLTHDDIDIVFLSHYHPDHFLNIRLFPGRDIYDAVVIWSSNGEENMPNGERLMGRIPGTDIEILPTPGHASEHASLLISTKEHGKVCIAQDVFWWIDGKQPNKPTKEDLLSIEDPFMSDRDALISSRKKVMEVSDWIVPGHGKMFKNPLRS